MWTWSRWLIEENVLTRRNKGELHLQETRSGVHGWMVQCLGYQKHGAVSYGELLGF